jgi:hypothetical protein
MSTTDIGTTIAISTGIPATFDEAGYEAMTWTPVPGLVSIGEVGDDHASIQVPDLETGRSKTLKGELTGTTTPLAFREIAGNAGQAAMKAACATRGEYSFRIAEPDGAERYLSGVAMSYKRNARNNTSYAGFTCSITNNYDEVSGT